MRVGYHVYALSTHDMLLGCALFLPTHDMLLGCALFLSTLCISGILIASYRYNSTELRSRLVHLLDCSAVVVRGSADAQLNGLYHRERTPLRPDVVQEDAALNVIGQENFVGPVFVKIGRIGRKPDVGLFQLGGFYRVAWILTKLPVHNGWPKYCECGTVARGHVVANCDDGSWRSFAAGTKLEWRLPDYRTATGIEVVCAGDFAATQIQKVWRGMRDRRRARRTVQAWRTGRACRGRSLCRNARHSAKSTSRGA